MIIQIYTLRESCSAEGFGFTSVCTYLCTIRSFENYLHIHAKSDIKHKSRPQYPLTSLFMWIFWRFSHNLGPLLKMAVLTASQVIVLTTLTMVLGGSAASERRVSTPPTPRHGEVRLGVWTTCPKACTCDLHNQTGTVLCHFPFLHYGIDLR